MYGAPVEIAPQTFTEDHEASPQSTVKEVNEPETVFTVPVATSEDEVKSSLAEPSLKTSADAPVEMVSDVFKLISCLLMRR